MRIAGALDNVRAAALLDGLLSTQPARAPHITGEETLVLYGAGDLGALALDFLAHAGLEPVAILDRQATPGATLRGIPLFTPDTYTPAANACVLVTISSMAYAPIAAALAEAGWKHILPFYDYAEAFRDTHPLHNGWFAGPLAVAERDAIRQVMAQWADEASRAAYLQFLAWRIAREEWSFDHAQPEPADRFFIPQLRAALGAEIFVDAGAYDGRVLRKLLQLAPGLRGAYLFEPDSANRARLTEEVGALPDALRERITIRAEALSDRNGMQDFSPAFGMASRLGGPGGAAQPAIALDTLDLAPGFMKFHLEGGEHAALLGSMGTLKRHRPLLAVTLYHNRDGLWKIARLLMDQLPHYRFYFRAHGWCGTGAVLYAIPEERSGTAN